VRALGKLASLGLTLRLRDGRLSVSPAGRLEPADLEAMRPWATSFRRLARKPMTPWRSASLAKAFAGADDNTEQRLARLIEVFNVTGIDDRRDPALFRPRKKGVSHESN